MTFAEKILAKRAGLKTVSPGDFVEVDVDLVLANDVTGPLAISQFKNIGAKKVFDPEKIVFVPDHFTPNKDINSAQQCKILREFSKEHAIKHYFEIGEAGVEHVLLPEKGLVLPGDIVIGADSHTCTYGALGAFATGMGSTDIAAAMVTGRTWFKVPETIKFVYKGTLKPWVEAKDLILFTIKDIGVDGALYCSMEFSGEVIEKMSMAGRFTMANMAIEAGGKCGIVVPDEITIEYISSKAKRPYTIYRPDNEAKYVDIREYNVSEIEPQVAFPPLPSNVKAINEVGNIPIDQVFIGSCTNGRIEDLRTAAKVLKGKKVSSNVRLIIIPTTPSVYLQALKEGLIEIFLNAGATIGPPTCGPCLGGHMGILAKGERAVATTNRNFTGRMGHPESEIYLSNPAVAAASAVLGRIGSPEEL